VLDAAAVETGDRLELVERDDHRAAALGGEASGQREHLVRQPGDVAVGPDERKRHRDAVAPAGIGLVADLGPGRGDCGEQPGAGALPARFHRRQRAGVAFEERDVGAVAADGYLDRERPAPGQGGQRLADQGRFAVAAR
jgi:hypothetical protein